jgi:hypothetical protein
MFPIQLLRQREGRSRMGLMQLLRSTAGPIRALAVASMTPLDASKSSLKGVYSTLGSSPCGVGW